MYIRVAVIIDFKAEDEEQAAEVMTAALQLSNFINDHTLYDAHVIEDKSAKE
jgi:hypothetical protein